MKLAFVTYAKLKLYQTPVITIKINNNIAKLYLLIFKQTMSTYRMTKEYGLSFISNEDLFFHVKETIESEHGRK